MNWPTRPVGVRLKICVFNQQKKSCPATKSKRATGQYQKDTQRQTKREWPRDNPPRSDCSAACYWSAAWAADWLLFLFCSFFFFILVLHSPLFAASDRLNGIQTLFNRLRIGDRLLQSKSKRQQCESSRYLIDPDAHLKLSIGLAK